MSLRAWLLKVVLDLACDSETEECLEAFESGQEEQVGFRYIEICEIEPVRRDEESALIESSEVQ